jgi:hypothetical protein
VLTSAGIDESASMAETAKERIRFACEECDQLLSIGVSRIGQSITCPKCGCSNEVPDADAAALQIADRKRRKEQRRKESAEDFTQFEVYDDDTEFVFETDDDDEGYYGGRVDRNKVAVPRFVLYTQGALLGVVAIAAFVLGWIVGAATSGPAHVAVEDNTPRVIRGTLKYVADGTEQPDAGSVVILVPQDGRPTIDEKVPAQGLGPDDQPPEASLQRIMVMGGAYARTDVNGAYRLQVPKRGRYFMLVISANAASSGGEDYNKEHLAQMGRYFVQATDLIGGRRFRWSSEEIGRDMTVDYSFEGS